MATQAEDFFPRLPLNKRLAAIVWLFGIIVLFVFLMGEFRADVLTGVRAYVAGEGLWSTAEKEAVRNLLKYAQSHSESDYRDYLAEIAVPLGDRQARLEL